MLDSAHFMGFCYNIYVIVFIKNMIDEINVEISPNVFEVSIKIHFSPYLLITMTILIGYLNYLKFNSTPIFCMSVVGMIYLSTCTLYI